MTHELTDAAGLLDRFAHACHARGEAIERQHTDVAGRWLTIIDECRAALLAHLAQRGTSLNQCDGCMQGAALRNGLHIDKDGRSFMACERARYESPQAVQPMPDGVKGGGDAGQ